MTVSADRRRSARLLATLVGVAGGLALWTGVALGAPGQAHDHSTAPTPQPAAAAAPTPVPVLSSLPSSEHEGHAGFEQGAEADAHRADADARGGDAGSHGADASDANWYVVGGSALIIGGSTAGASATKRRLARKIASGELAGAGVRDV